MEVSGHMAAVGHTWALGNAQDHRDMDGDLGHGVCIQMLVLLDFQPTVLFVKLSGLFLSYVAWPFLIVWDLIGLGVKWTLWIF